MCKDGDKLLREIEKKMENKTGAIDTIISKLKTVEDSSVPNSIFNYLNVVIETAEKKKKHSLVVEVETPKKVKTEECKMHDISSERIMKEPSSPISSQNRSSASIDTSSRKEKGLLKRKSTKVEEITMNVEELVNEFC